MRMGMVSTAHDKFKKLRMWSDAIDCLMIADRKVEALEMVRGLLEADPSPRLWCCLGDLEKEPAHYEKAWEMSGCRFARAQRSLGRFLLRKGHLAEAVDSFKLALDINPLHADIWFSCGCLQMKLERYEDAVYSFSRSIGVEDENGEAWGNLAAVHVARGTLREARTCIEEAVRRCRENWRMWESHLGICLRLRDIAGIIRCMRRLVELEKMDHFDENVLGAVCSAVISDDQNVFAQTGKAFTKKLTEFFEFATSKTSSVPFIWRWYAELQEFECHHEEALDSRLKQCRATQAKLWDETDPDRFSERLEELRECFASTAAFFEGPHASGVGRKWQGLLQPIAYSVRNAEKRLKQRLEQPGCGPKWQSTYDEIAALAIKIEAKAEAVAASGENTSLTESGS